MTSVWVLLPSAGACQRRSLLRRWAVLNLLFSSKGCRARLPHNDAKRFQSKGENGEFEVRF